MHPNVHRIEKKYYEVWKIRLRFQKVREKIAGLKFWQEKQLVTFWTSVTKTLDWKFWFSKKNQISFEARMTQYDFWKILFWKIRNTIRPKFQDLHPQLSIFFFRLSVRLTVSQTCTKWTFVSVRMTPCQNSWAKNSRMIPPIGSI